MTVKELIEELSKLNPHAYVQAHYIYAGDYEDVVALYTEGNFVWIKTSSDLD